jgi:vacuolar-type H+-ATPase subunit I/STV1
MLPPPPPLKAIVDAYGMARYKEFNPAVFTVITFPFLFGVMFGDIGHGFMMTLAAGLLCAFERALAPLAEDEMFGTVYAGRCKPPLPALPLHVPLLSIPTVFSYLSGSLVVAIERIFFSGRRYNLLLMGLFATYAGFIYNEVFSVPMEAFGNTMWCSGEMSDAACWDTPGVNASTSMQKWLRSNIREAWDFTAGQTTGKEVRRAARAPVFSLCIALCCCDDCQ